MIDTKRGGVVHDLTSPTVIGILIEVAGWSRCRFVLISIECRTWSAVLGLPDAHGRPGKVYRDVDNVLGIKDANGMLPPIVVAHNHMARGAAAIARAHLIAETPTCRRAVLAETPACRRTGTPDATPGCERHVYMYDHPAWAMLISEFGAVIHIIDQCRYLDDEVNAVNTGPKATALLFAGAAIEPGTQEFKGKRCRHAHGTHKPLRGTDAEGKYLTAGTARYSSKLCGGISRVVIRCIGTVTPGEVSALVAGVLHGKRLPRGSVDAQYFHDCWNHSETRVLDHLGDALSDFEPWMAEEIRRNPIGPCDSCLRGSAPRIGPSGGLPQDEGLIFMDFYHCNIPAIFTGNTARLTTKHAGKSKLVKSVSCGRKSDAPVAFQCVLALYNSLGHPINHVHTDCANELRAGGVAAIARQHLVRITTTVPSVSRTNGTEPVHRVGGDVVRKTLCRARMPLCFHDLCWAHFEDGHSLKPKREPPHACALGILTGKKPAGCHRRPFGLLCYVTVTDRLPSGTLVNKYKEQAVRCLHVGYSGSLIGAFETIKATERAQPGYLCFEPETCQLLCSESVRFIPGCFPGLKRTAGGGWCIPPERIPFSAEALAQKHPLAEPKDHSNEDGEHDDGEHDGGHGGHEHGDGVIDIGDGKGSDPIGDFDYDRLTYTKGLPHEAEGTAPHAESAPAEAPPPAPVDDTPAPPPKPRAMKVLVPRAMWPDHRCDENEGAGWTAEVIDKKGKWSRCKFINATDSKGQKFYSEWIETARLQELAHEPEESTRDGVPTPAAEAETEEQPNPSPPTTPDASLPEPPQPTTTLPPRPTPPPDATPPTPIPAPDQWLVPNSSTLPHEHGTDPLKEPIRPQRERRPVDRFVPEMLAAQYMTAAGLGLGEDMANAWKTPHAAALYVELDGMGERFVDLALAADPLAETAHLAEAFESLPEEAQRGACVLADYHALAATLGATSPQAKLARDVYASAMLDAACIGVVLPPIDPLYNVTALLQPGQPAHGGGGDPAEARAATSTQVEEDDIFDKDYDGHMVSLPSHPLAFGELSLVAKKRTSPDIYSEKEMAGKEWDEPKQIEVNKLMEMVEKVAADDPSVGHLKPVDTMFTGRDKRDANRRVVEKKGRCVLRGDIHKQFYRVSDEQAASPVVRNTSASCSDAVSALRCRHVRSGDVPTAYLQGDQNEDEQVLARPPHGFREFDERGVEILWLMRHPLYGQVDAGAIWNRTFNATLVNPRGGGERAAPPVTSANSEAKVTLCEAGGVARVDADTWRDDRSAGLGAERCTYDPCVYSRVVNGEGDRVVTNIYVDDVRSFWDPAPEACEAAKEDQELLHARHRIKWGAVDPPEDYFLGANRSMTKARDAVTVAATTYIDSMDARYLDGKGATVTKEYPGTWSTTPADEKLTRAYEEAILKREAPSKELYRRYNSVVGSLRHVVKYRPDISAAMDLLGCCLTFPTEALYDCAIHVLVYLVRTRKLGITYSKHAPDAKKLWALADSNWRSTRSTSGYCIFLAGAAISCCTRRQACIAMSSTEAELVALAECAIELLSIVGVLASIGYVVEKAIEVGTDNSGAWSLCHRYTSAQHSRHIDRKLFKMRELRGAGRVTVKYVPTDENTADLFTKVLSRQPFEKHRKRIFNNA